MPVNGPPPLPLPRRRGYERPALGPLDVRELAALADLPLRARMLTEALGTGAHHSRRLGSDVEFADYRDYQAGDDLKRIDWRLYARTDRLHVRRTHADTPLRLVLLLDGSQSMAFAGAKGRLTKLDHARALLGALALLARRRREACGAGLLGAELVQWLTPSAAISRMDAVWSLLESPVPILEIAFAETLDQVLAVAPSRCLFVLASDFYVEPEKLAPALRRLRSEGHELLALRVLDPVEIDLSFRDAGEFMDIESGDHLVADPAAAASTYRKAFNRHALALQEIIGAESSEIVTLRTDELPLEGLRAYLAKRGRRI